MEKKILMVCTTASMIGNFNLPNIKLLQDMGYEVQVACNFLHGSNWSSDKSKQLKKKLTAMNVKSYQINFARSPFKISDNLNAYFSLKKVIKANDYSFIHCQTPVGGLVTRLITKGEKLPVIYTAHGFHFFKGAPLKNWLFYYPVEKYLSKYTDTLVTINDEDFNFASKHMNSKKTIEIPGAGVRINRFRRNPEYRQEIRDELNIQSDELMLLSVGELNANKNHEVILKALSNIKNKKIIYVIAGVGAKKKQLLELARKSKINLRLVGFSSDVEKFYSAADIFVFPSKREGLSFAGIEAMAAGLPIIGSNIRGVKDYVYNNKSGFLVSPDNFSGFAEKIDILLKNKQLQKQMGSYNTQTAEKYDIKNVDKIMNNIYKSYF